VPMFVLSGCHQDMIWPATCHHSEQNVVNGILIFGPFQLPRKTL
jgi:hypothetical protein